MAIDNEILKDFKSESKGLIEEMLELLEEADGEPRAFKNLDRYGQTVDRIMGGAKSLIVQCPEDFPASHALHRVGDYAAICKSVGYKTSQVSENHQLFNVCVAFLLDATEVLKKMVDDLKAEESGDLEKMLTKTFLERLRWINSQFSSDIRATVGASESAAPSRLKQTEIDELLEKLMGGKGI